VERELVVSCKGFFIACSSRTVVGLLLGTFSPAVDGFDYLNGKNNILLERSPIWAEINLVSKEL
jgi:hypothetical protein